MTDDDAVIDKALVLVADIAEALAAGTRHYAADGRRLLTVPEVIEELQTTGRVRLEEAVPS